MMHNDETPAVDQGFFRGLWVALMLVAIVVAIVVVLSGCMPMPQAKAAVEEPIIEDTPTPLPVEGEAQHVLPSVTPTPWPICTVSTGVEGGTVNVRSGPGMMYRVVDVVSEGEVLPLFGDPVGGWQKVTTARLVDGWFYVSKWCLKGR